MQYYEDTYITVQQYEDTYIAVLIWVVAPTGDGKAVAKDDADFNQMFLVGHKVCTAYTAKTGKKARCRCVSFFLNLSVLISISPQTVYRFMRLVFFF